MRGQEEGRKDRPSVITLCTDSDATGPIIVTVLPITHRAPSQPGDAVEIPLTVKRHLGLHDEPSWIAVNEGNGFEWPGHDLRLRPDGSYAFGFLPPRLFKQVQLAFVELVRTAKARATSRD